MVIFTAQVGLSQGKEPIIANTEPTFNITDQENIETLAQLIAAETTGITYAIADEDDMELAIVVAHFIKQVISNTHSGCIIKGGRKSCHSLT